MKDRTKVLKSLLELQGRILSSKVRQEGSDLVVVFQSELEALEKATELVFDQEEEGGSN